jgi:hypothetical protein
MSRILDKLRYKNTDSESIITFETTGGGDWKVWDRFISLKGKKAYHIGNICGTCSFFFERLEGANTNVSPKQVSSELRTGIKNINNDFITAISKIIPDGDYEVCLLEVNPKLIEIGSSSDYFANEQIEYWGMNGFWGLPHYPKVKYYRGNDQRLSDTGLLYEFIIPMTPQNWLEDGTVKEYQELLKKKSKPTALAISILDVKTFYDSNESHWCLAHYLLDGHHKVYASSLESEPITILSFLALGQGVSSEDEVKELLGSI